MLPACLIAAVPDRLVPRWPSTEAPSYDRVLERKLAVTRADYGRAFILHSPASAGEESVAVWSDDGACRVTRTKASRNIYYAVTAPNDPEYHGPVSVSRSDAVIPASTAGAIRRAWTAMLHQTARTPGYDADRIPIHPTEYQFSVSIGARTLVGTTQDAIARGKTAELISIVQLLVKYCQSSAAARVQIATRIEAKAKRLAAAAGDVTTKRPNQAMQLTASKRAVYASSVCRRKRMLRGMHSGLAAADLVSR